MCSPAVFYIAAAISAASAIKQGQQQKEWNDYQADQATADAKAEKSAAMVEAERIRKMARIQAGEATAAMAGSGINVSEGSALNINEDIYRGAEEDAVTTIFGGNDRSKRGFADAAGYRLKGRQAQTAGYLNATSTALSAASSGSGSNGWKKS